MNSSFISKYAITQYLFSQKPMKWRQ